jgi:hypothetical protein
MSVTFTKLFSSITESTVWCEPSDIRIVWITMLAMSDRHGRVWGSIPGLANRAQVPVESARIALQVFLSPDPDSRTKDHDGRRIREIDGGWALLNHGKYRAIRDEEERKAYKAAKEREYRAVKRGKTHGQNGQSCIAVDSNGHNADTEADADADAGKAKTLPRASRKATDPRHHEFRQVMEKAWSVKNKEQMPWGPAEAKQLSLVLSSLPALTIEGFTSMLRHRHRSEVNHAERPRVWLPRISDYANGPIDRFGKPIAGIKSSIPVPDATVELAEKLRRAKEENERVNASYGKSA